MKTSIILAAAAALGVVTLAPTARAQRQFDGTYRGEPTSGNGCSLFHLVLRVSNGMATMRYNSTIMFEGKVERTGRSTHRPKNLA